MMAGTNRGAIRDALLFYRGGNDAINDSFHELWYQTDEDWHHMFSIYQLI